MWDLPGPGLEPVSTALAGGFLTTAPPGKPQWLIFNARGERADVQHIWVRGHLSEITPDFDQEAGPGVVQTHLIWRVKSPPASFQGWSQQCCFTSHRETSINPWHRSGNGCRNDSLWGEKWELDNQSPKTPNTTRNQRMSQKVSFNQAWLW